MIILLSSLLLVNAVYNAVVWPRFLKRVSVDPRATDADGKRTRFYTVHLALVTVALVLAGASAIAGIAGLVTG
ncbi:SCO4848 family membrane protein [Demequina sp.]|uniref:SCO4848 family membrane protein n=1 Tax=Demequina sp. TaxID=2050685 RepID=UPI003A862C4F